MQRDPRVEAHYWASFASTQQPTKMTMLRSKCMLLITAGQMVNESYWPYGADGLTSTVPPLM